MIRINLLGADRQRARKSITFDIAQRLTLACSLILVAAALGVGWWYWSLSNASSTLDAEIASARSRQLRLASLLSQVQQFQTRRGQLQQRVALIEQLRAGQSLPVQLLDHVSRSLPDTLWLTLMEQSADTITLEGRSTTVPALTAFVTNLGNSPLLQKPIDIVDAKQELTTTPGQQTGVELLRFTVRARLAPASPAPGTAAPPGTPASAPAPPPGGAR
jgi:type IV pilus assembly protein PilN